MAKKTAGAGRNWRMTIEYKGSAYNGWQKQKNGPSVQQELESALSTVLRETVKITGAGRTDAGVHALGQVANFRGEREIKTDRLGWQLNAVLPDDIKVRDLAPAPDDFHARHSAVGRSYRYLILNQGRQSVFWREYSWWVAKPLNLEAAREAAGALVGTHDFAGFTVAKEGPTIRRIDELIIDQAENETGADRIVEIRISANAFLHHMVRLIVGTLVEVASGKRPMGDVKKILAGKDVRLAGPRAPAKGLWLERIEYR